MRFSRYRSGNVSTVSALSMLLVAIATLTATSCKARKTGGAAQLRGDQGADVADGTEEVARPQVPCSDPADCGRRAADLKLASIFSPLDLPPTPMSLVVEGGTSYATAFFKQRASSGPGPGFGEGEAIALTGGSGGAAEAVGLTPEARQALVTDKLQQAMARRQQILGEVQPAGTAGSQTAAAAPLGQFKSFLCARKYRTSTWVSQDTEFSTGGWMPDDEQTYKVVVLYQSMPEEAARRVCQAWIDENDLQKSTKESVAFEWLGGWVTQGPTTHRPDATMAELQQIVKTQFGPVDKVVNFFEHEWFWCNNRNFACNYSHNDARKFCAKHNGRMPLMAEMPVLHDRVMAALPEMHVDEANPYIWTAMPSYYDKQNYWISTPYNWASKGLLRRLNKDKAHVICVNDEVDIPTFQVTLKGGQPTWTPNEFRVKAAKSVTMKVTSALLNAHSFRIKDKLNGTVAPNQTSRFDLKSIQAGDVLEIKCIPDVDFVCAKLIGE